VLLLLAAHALQVGLLKPSHQPIVRDVATDAAARTNASNAMAVSRSGLLRHVNRAGYGAPAAAQREAKVRMKPAMMKRGSHHGRASQRRSRAGSAITGEDAWATQS